MRSEVLPDVPTIGESVRATRRAACMELLRRGTRQPKSSTSSTGKSTRRSRPAMKTRLADLGGIALAGSAAEFGKLIAVETEKWAKVIRTGNIKAQ